MMKDSEINKESYYRAVVEDLTELVCRFRPDGTFTFVNEVYCRFFGKTRDELIGSSWQPRALAEDLSMIKSKLGSMSAENPVVVIENRVYNGSGEVRWMQFINRGFYDSNGMLTEIQSVGRDITERKNAEIALLQERKRFFDVLERLPVMICLLAPDYHVPFANKAFREKFGDSRGRRCYEYCFYRHEPCEFCETFNVLKTGRPHHWEVTVCDGSIIDVHDLPFVDVDGSELILEMDIDITERRKAEEGLRTYSRRLIELEEKMRRNLSAELHDRIGRDLAALSLNFSFIFGALSSESKESLGSSIADCESLIKEIGNAVRDIMADLRPPVLDDYGLVAALRWYVDRLSSRSGAKIDLLSVRDIPRLSLEKEMALFRIAQEAILNAVKHSGASRVTLTLDLRNSRLTLSIFDNGTGFDEKAHDLRKNESGWGLSIMRDRAESAGALFSLKSEKGRGTGISVVLDIGN